MNRWDKMNKLSRNEIKDIVIKTLKDNVEKFQDVDLDESTKLNTQKGIDSMTFIYIMCKLEEEFDIKISEKNYDKLETLGDLIDEIKGEL